MQMNFIPSFDGIATQQTPKGSIYTFDNGTIGFVPDVGSGKLSELLPEGSHNLTIAMQALDKIMKAKGLLWSKLHTRTNRSMQGYASSLANPNHMPSGSPQPTLIEIPNDEGGAPLLRVPRTEQQLLELLEVTNALIGGCYKSLMTPEVQSYVLKELAKVDRKAAIEATFTREHWPVAALGLRVTVDSSRYNIAGPKDSLLIKAFKASKGIWSPRTSSWAIPKSEEVALGKRLVKVAAELEKFKSTNGDALKVLLEAERASPLSGGARVHCGFNPSFHSYTITFDFNRKAIEALRSVPGAQFKESAKSWSVPLASREALKKALPKIEATFVKQAVNGFGKASEKASIDTAQSYSSGQACTPARKTSREGLVVVHMFSDKNGSSLPKAGRVFKQRGSEQALVALEISKGRWIEDASSLGGDIFNEYQFRIKARNATEKEVTDDKAART
jgi:hypothetical protein